MPLDHVSVPVPHAKLEEEIKFITTAFAPLGIKEHFRPAPGVVGLGDAVPFLWVVGIDENHKPIEEEEGKPGRSCHLALKAADRAQVDAFHKAALEAGGKCNGKPGIREMYHPGYYAAFVIDPCGNNVEAVVHEQAATPA